MIQKIWKVEETPESRMFMKASGCCRLEEHGYVEEEYFFRGTANIYGEDGRGKAEILYADAPYTNRFVVRRPKENPSGRVVIEILNSSSYMDIDRFWVLTYRKLLRDRDTYIGITSKPVTMKSLKKFDHKRYQPLCWKNPRPSLFFKMDLGNFRGASEPETEDGLFWDMLTELAQKVREGADFLSPLSKTAGELWRPERVYLAGWSQSGSYMVTYTNYFAKARYERKEAPVFDGYFSAAPGPCVVPGLNQSEMADIYAGEAT
ncbi:MAG: alpha/beta hydrolase domain-containing protein [Eubacteriales bacterium]|nr:alpha/beta hydrolase domain-containing protein [Eubacteriales bacterium]